jgi:hypothetical protein
MAALPGLSPVEQLIHHEDRDQQDQQACHSVSRQRVSRPPAPLPGVGELDDDKRQRDQHRQAGSQPPYKARGHPTTLWEPDPDQSRDGAARLEPSVSPFH